ncbi:MAG TPA: hydroxymethylbilane synthase [Candidatus Krumholzibacteria bacterium]|nr:hydroxymethylbilane synthase [Candidatus Krumholzibacteria bacterium]
MNDTNTPAGLPRPLRIGTRGSDLALWQAHHVRDLLQELGAEPELVIIETRGDRIDDVPFSKLEGKGFFTKELEDAQLDGRVDLAVHSMKDLSSEQPEGLTVCALIGREDPRELLLVRKESVDAARAEQPIPLADGAKVGTSAARRQGQLKLLRPDLEIADLRGNVPTRIRKLREGQYDAILLAKAGVTRLGLDLSDLHVVELDVETFVPAPAQGMLALQCRDEEPLKSFLNRLETVEAAVPVKAERRLLEKLDGGCQLPFGVNIRRQGGGFRLAAYWSATPESAPLTFTLEGPDAGALADEAFARIRGA